MSINPVRSSSPLNGPPRLSFSIVPAHTLHRMGCNASVPMTRPMHTRKTEIIVSADISSGSLGCSGDEYEAADEG